MKKMIQFLSVAAVTLISAVATAQPLPPYVILVSGTLAPCSPPGTPIELFCAQNNSNPVTSTLYVNTICSFSDSIMVNDFSGTIELTYPCNGALQTVSAPYSINVLQGTEIQFTLLCNSTEVDCMGVVGGSALPGTPCDDFIDSTINDVWTSECNCQGTIAQLPPYVIVITGQISSCNPSGGSVEIFSQQQNNVPVTATFSVDANCSFIDSILVTDPAGMISVSYDCNGTSQTISVDYIISPFVGNYMYLTLPCSSTEVDCLGIVGGSALPGTACDDNDAGTMNDMWTSECTCQGEPILPGECAADFWVVQGYTFGPGENPNTIDTTVVLPIPNELWVWNLSESSTGMMSFLWSFGDGTSSTASFPTHVYEGTGPYELCLTITDASGCTDSYCQTISVDGDGIIVGVAGDDLNDSRSVLTLNVVSQQPLGVNDLTVEQNISLWPNPVQNSINLSISSKVNAQMTMSITDMNGKVVSQMKNTLHAGNNRVQMDVSDLKAGMYLMQIGNGTQSTSRRFVKQ
jgi:hypothetical protein